MLLAILRRLVADEAATSAIEYALIAAIVSLAAVGALGALGRDVADIFVEVEAGMIEPLP